MVDPSVAAVEFGLGVEGIDVRDAAVHEAEDDVPRPRGEVRSRRGGGVRLPRERAVVLGLLSGAAFWLNGILFVVSMIFFCVLLYLYSGRLRRMAAPSVVLVATSVIVFVVGAFVHSDGIREVALALLIGGLVLLGPVRESLPFFAAAVLYWTLERPDVEPKTQTD